MPQAPPKSTVSALVVIAAMAVAVNLLGFWLAQEVIAGRFTGDLPSTDQLMEIALLPADEGEDAPQEEEPEGELVQNHAVADERPPADTERISEFDSDVEHETRAPNRPDGAPQPPTKPGDSPDAEHGERPSEQPSPADHESATVAERDARGDAGEGSEPTDDDLREDVEGQVASKMGAGGGRPLPGITGSPDLLKRTFGGPGSIDRLDDVDEGDANILDSRRSRYASFFNRVRDQVAQHWHPEIVHGQRDPEGKIYGEKLRITKLMIRLDPDGSVRRIVVEGPSGVGFLDEEAIRAVRAAQPFTNPPSQLVDEATGFIDFGFRFIFEIDGSRRIFRYSQ